MVAMLILTLLAGLAIWAYLRSTNQAATPPSMPTSSSPSTPSTAGPPVITDGTIPTPGGAPPAYTQTYMGPVSTPPPPPTQLPPFNSGNAPTVTTPVVETRTGIGHFQSSQNIIPAGSSPSTSNYALANAILAQGPPAGSVQPPGTYWNYLTKSWTPLLA